MTMPCRVPLISAPLIQKGLASSTACVWAAWYLDVSALHHFTGGVIGSGDSQQVMGLDRSRSLFLAKISVCRRWNWGNRRSYSHFEQSSE